MHVCTSSGHDSLLYNMSFDVALGNFDGCIQQVFSSINLSCLSTVWEGTGAPEGDPTLTVNGLRSQTPVVTDGHSECSTISAWHSSLHSHAQSDAGGAVNPSQARQEHL